MKKQCIALSLAAVLFLGGCSILEDVTNTATYVKAATNYANEVDTFVSEVPTLAEQAVNNKETLLELETKLEEMKEDIKTFSELKAPAIADDLHQQIVEQSQKSKEGIDSLLNKIKDGKLDPARLKNIEIFESSQGIKDIIEQIKQLGQ